LFDLLALISTLISENGSVEDLFKEEDLTRWNSVAGGIQKQRFELDLNGNGGSYRYVLE